MIEHSVAAEADALLEETIDLRRRLHRHPEVGLTLPRTQATVLEALDGLGLDVISTGKRTSSVIAHLIGARPGPTVLLRADMDALPLQEETGLEFASEVDGAMHACGHDSHTAMLLGAAKLLAGRRKELAGSVVFVFQPGEEGHGGAQVMLEEGLIEQHGPFDRAYAIHQAPVYASGTIAWKAGSLCGSNDLFHVRLHGKGGHASAPHVAVDPIPPACELVGALQMMVTRRIDAFDPTVVTIARIQGGTTYNVIPETAELLGTVRTVSAKVRSRIHDSIREMAERIAAAHGCEVEVGLDHTCPVTVNDPDQARRAADIARRTFGEERVQEIPRPGLGAEDFSIFLERVPGAVVVVGTRPPGVARPEPLHSPRMVLDESALSTGVAMYSALALDDHP